jgi:5,10-methylenetetrahydromethanopterin reductase
MRIGAMIRGMTIDEIIENVHRDREEGYTSVWLTDAAGMEPLTTLAVVGRAIPDIELGTAVVRTLPRHPMALAQQAMTVNSIVGGRLALGIGPSHRPTVERGWGLSFDRPIARMRDYLSVLASLMRDGTVSYEGQTVSAHGELHIENSGQFPLLVAALGPQMLRLAGRMADGTITFMVGPRTLRGFTCPTIIEAAAAADRPRPRIVALLSVCVTADIEAITHRAQRAAERSSAMPSYAAMLKREGGPPLIAGTESEVEEAIGVLEEAGVTDLVPVRVARSDSDDERRTTGLLRRLCG